MSSESRFQWSIRLRPYRVPGLSSCVEDGSLTLDGVRVAASQIDLFGLRLAEWSYATRESLILCPPGPFGVLPALIAAAAHIRSIVDHYEETGRQRGSSLRVAVITRNLRLRGIYRRLGIGTAPMSEVVPPATRTSGGEVCVLGSDPGRGWSTIFLSRPAELAALDEDIDLVVAELPLEEAERLKGLEVPVIAVAHDPSDHALTTLAKEMALFAWDEDDLRQFPSLGVGSGSAMAEELHQLECFAAGQTMRCLSVPAQAVSENAALFWEDIGPLLRAAGRSLFGRELAAAAFVLFYDLLHLAVPTAIYEAVTSPLKSRLRDLAASQRLVEGDLRDIYVPMVATELRDLSSAIGGRSPKAVALERLLLDRVSDCDEILLLARTAELARIHRTHIEGDDRLRDKVRVASLWGVAAEQPADLVVIPGLLPAATRFLYSSGLGAEVVTLAYQAERPLLSGEDAFQEYRVVADAAAYQRAYATWRARDAAKAACWQRLSGEPSELTDDEPEPPRLTRTAETESGQGPLVPPEAPPGLLDGALASLADLDHRLQLADAPVLATETIDGDGDGLEVDAIRIDFLDDRWMLIEANSTITLWGREGAEAGHVAAEVKRGDQMVVFDGEAKKDLLAKVIEIAGDLPELAIPAAWVDTWRVALQRAYQRFGTYRALGESLAKRGCRVQTQSVRLWVVGQTIGPDDPLDIKRVGEVLEDEILIENYERVSGAVNALRRSHVRLGQRLGALARRIGPEAADGLIEADEVIDEQSGLTAADFGNSVEILEVAATSSGGRIPYAVAGRIWTGEELEVEVV